uniref:asparagine synthase-related protein n=1 Tax=Sphingomonas bacterium TaxID=1895847 RepID=UPI00261F90CE|nr:asparagine synthase C-terminal domain-containing protein [Sphingomonas bacterium]
MAEIAELRGSRGEILFEQYWGSYVAVIEDPDTSEVHVLRDPIGEARCFHAGRDGITGFASEPGLLIAAGLVPASIDWGGLAQHLLYEQLQAERTALRDVGELLAGTRMTVGRGRTCTTLWSPWRHAARASLIRDEGEAAGALRRTVQECTSAWAGCFDRSIASVSGGLDSSIVAAGLAGASADFRCITFVTADPSGDERDYAAALSDHVGVPLAEHLLDVSDVDLARSGGARFARPVARSFAQAGDAATLALARACGAQALFNGAGGDNVFCFLQSAAPLADRVFVEGFGKGAWQTLGDISALAPASYWDVARSAGRKLMSRRKRYPWKADAAFLHPDLNLPHEAACRHPWLDAPDDALPGKAAHIALLLRIQNHLQTERSLTLPTVSPLLSQPVAELCLRIPSWMWCGGGENRHIARKAFADALPRAVIDRRSKGTPDSFVAALFEKNRAWIAETLLDGLMAREGLLDRAAISRSIAENRIVRGHDYWRLMRLVDAETWTRSWTGCA